MSFVRPARKHRRSRITPAFVLAAMTITIHSPFFASYHKRPVFITRREYKLIVAVMAGWKGSQRELAQRLGYSIGGLAGAISTLRAAGVLAVQTRRGCNGATRLKLRNGVHVTNNVRVLGDGDRKRPYLVTTAETTYPNIPISTSQGPPFQPLEKH